VDSDVLSHSNICSGHGTWAASVVFFFFQFFFFKDNKVSHVTQVTMAHNSCLIWLWMVKEQTKYKHEKLVKRLLILLHQRKHPYCTNSFAYQYVKHQSQCDSHITETRGSSMSAKLFRFDCSL